MPTPLYHATFASLDGHDPAYYDLPQALRGLADAARAARESWDALSYAATQARTRGEWAAAEELGELEMAAWRHWQALEHRGELLADTLGAPLPRTATPRSVRSSVAAASIPAPIAPDAATAWGYPGTEAEMLAELAAPAPSRCSFCGTPVGQDCPHRVTRARLAAWTREERGAQ